MKIFGKNVSAYAHVIHPGDPFFLGLGIDKDVCEGCGEPYTNIQIGLGICMVGVSVHNH